MFREILATEQSLLEQCMLKHDCGEEIIKTFVSKLHDLNFVILINEVTSELVRFRVWKKEPIATISHILASNQSLSDALNFMWNTGIRCFYRIERGKGINIPRYTRYVEYSGGTPAPFYVDILSGRQYPSTVEIHSFIK